MKRLCILRKTSLAFGIYWIKFLTWLLIFLSSFASYGQSRMSEKEAFIFTIVANNFSLDEAAWNHIMGQPPLIWSDLYADFFDKTNFRNTLNDEFKRQPYKTKINNQIKNLISNLDFNKTFYFTSIARFDKYNMESGVFPINGEDIIRNLVYLVHNDEYNMFFSIGTVFNFDDFDFFLKMERSKAEGFVNSLKDNGGVINRKVDVKVIYNVVNKKQPASQSNQMYLGINIQKIIFMHGPTVLGELTPKTNNSGKQVANVNVVGYKDGSQLKSFGQINGCAICGTYFYKQQCIKIGSNGSFKHYWNCVETIPANWGVWCINDKYIVLYVAKKDKEIQAQKDFFENKINIEDYYTKDNTNEYQIEIGTLANQKKYLKWGDRVFK